MTVFDEINPKAVSVVMFAIVFLCILAIMVCVAFLFEKGHKKIVLILLILLAVIILAGSVFFLLWFNS